MRRLITSCIAVSISGTAIAQSQTNDPIIVKGTRLPSSWSFLETLSKDDISKQSPSSISDVLRKTNGIVVFQPSGTGRTEISLQGAEANFTTVLLDGVRVNNPSNSRGGSFDFTTISPDEIESINITQGGQSSIYGSNALSGVINIQTIGPGNKNNKKISTSASIGNNGYFSATGTVRIPSHASLTANLFDAGEPVKGATQTRSSIQGKWIEKIRNWEFASTIRATKGKYTNYPDASGGVIYSATDELENTETDTLLIGANVQTNLDENASLHLHTSYYQRSDVIATPFILDGILDGRPAENSDTDYGRTNLTGYLQSSPNEKFSFVVGVDLIEEIGKTDSETDFGFFSIPGGSKLDRTTIAGFAETQLDLTNNTEIFSSLRIDSIDGEIEPSWQIGALQQFSRSNVSLKYAEAFKAPSFYALGNALVGNPTLAAETSESWQANYTYDYSQFQFGLNAFHTIYTNLIDFDFSTFQLINRGETKIKGADANLAWASKDKTFSFSGNISYAETEINGIKQQITGRPEWSGGINANWSPTPSLNINANSEWVGKRPGNSVPTGPQDLKAYDHQNITANYKLDGQVSYFISATNILDSNIEDAIGFPSPGTNIRIGFKFTH